MVSRLFSVTHSGSVNDLYSLIQSEPHILENVEVSPFINTPLHEASAAGKLDMTMELMILKPSFAKKLNADGLSPLHLAVENKQVELALELVKFDPNLVRFPGRGGMTPLHLVAKNGNVDLLTEFLEACPESIRDANVNGETALHIMVINDRYKELEVLTVWMQRRQCHDALSTEIHILNKQDRQGNTVLHLAAYENNHKVIQQLLKCMSLNRNIFNKNCMTALDVVRANGPKMNRETEKIIRKSGGKIGSSLKSEKVLRTRVLFWEHCYTRMARYRSNFSDGARNALLIITALIITATYQTAVEPIEEDANHVDIRYNTLLLGFNTLAFVLALVLTAILLPPGKAYTWWYIVTMVPLVCSYGLSVYRKYKQAKSYFINIYLIVVLGFLIYLLECYVRWKRTRPRSLSPKTVMISEGNKTEV